MDEVFFPGQDEKLLHLSYNKKGWQYQIILILDPNNSIIYRTDCHIQFNYKYFCVQMIFLLKLKNCIWIKIFFPDFSLAFSKKSLVFLTFPDALINYLTFPDQVETLSKGLNMEPSHSEVTVLSQCATVPIYSMNL